MAQYVEGPYIVEDQPDGTRKVVGYSGQQAAPQSNTLITKQANPVEQRGDELKNQLTQVQIQKAIDELQKGDKPNLPTGYRMNADGTAELIPGVAAPGTGNKATAAQRTDAIQGFNDAAALRNIAKELRQRFEQGPGATQGVAAIQDFLPTASNRGFDSAAQRARGYVKRSLGFTGGEGNTVAESTALYDPYLPSASDYDSSILDKIAALEELANLAEGKSVSVLGGRPDASGNVVPFEQARQEAPVGNIPPTPQGPDRSAPLPTGPSFGGPQGDPSGFVPYGSTTRRMDNPQWAGVNEAVKGMIIAGQSPDAIRAYLGERGINTNVEGLNQAANYFRKTGKRDFRVNVDDIEVPMSGFEQFRNNAPQTAVGAGVASAANAVALGVPQALAPEQMQYIRDQNPFPSFVGDVAGIVGATSGIGTVGNSLARSLAPRALTGGGRLGNAARAVAPDAVYGAAYGGITEGDPLTGAATAAAGSGAGQLLGKGAQKLFQGARLDPNAQILRDAGMQNLTIGQSLGGFAKSLEDAGTSAPILGDIINARRAEGLQEFNLGRLNEAGAPIGATVTETGEDGLNQLMTQVGSAYDNATAGVNVPLDPQFAADMQAAAAAGQRLPPDYQVRFDKIGENRVGPILDARQMTGETYQQAMRGLKGARSSAGQAAPGFEQDYRDAVTLAMGALRGQMERGGGQNVIDGLAQADTANRLGKTLQNAMAAAKNDAGGAGVQIFTPAQLNTAAYAAQKKFPGPRPFADMADAAQMVLPSKIPDSGTARRGASLLLPVSLGGTGAGLDYYLTQTPGEGGAAGLATGALLLAGGSKGGQKALDKLLFKRPAAVRKFGGLFGGRKAKKGLSGVGVATAPLLIEQ